MKIQGEIYLTNVEDGKDASNVGRNILRGAGFTSVDNITDGGITLYRLNNYDSSKMSVVDGLDGVKALSVITASGETDLYRGPFFKAPVEAGVTYTLSVWAKGSGSLRLEVVDSDGTSRLNTAARYTTFHTLTSGWAQYTHTFTVHNNAKGWLEVNFFTNSEGTFYLTEPKLERGSAATAFCLNEADLRGEDGKDGISYKLVPVTESLRVVLDKKSGDTEPKQYIDCNMTYHVYKFVDDKPSLVPFDDNVALSASWNNGNDITFTIGKAKDSDAAYTLASYVFNNIEYTGNNAWSRITLSLKIGGNIVDTRVVELTFEPNCIFQVTQDGITTAVTNAKKYTDGQVDTVNNNISKVDIKADGIKTEVDNYKQSNGEAVTKLGSKIDQTAKSITESVTSRIAGRNLIYNSRLLFDDGAEYPDKWGNWETGTVKLYKGNEFNYIECIKAATPETDKDSEGKLILRGVGVSQHVKMRHSGSQPTDPIEPGAKYIYSVYAKAASASAGNKLYSIIHWRCRKEDGGEVNITGPNVSGTLTTEWQRFWTVMDAPSAAGVYKHDATFFHPMIGYYGTEAVDIFVSRPKLEKVEKGSNGNYPNPIVPTAWTPQDDLNSAKEDSEAAIKVASNSITESVTDLQTGIKKAGIDLTTGGITATGDHFQWETEKHEKLAYMDSEGNATFAGTLRADRIFTTNYLEIETKGSQVYFGKCKTKLTGSTQPAIGLGYPPSYLFVTTRKILNSTNADGNVGTIYLPYYKDVEGLVIDIYGTAYQPSSGTVTFIDTDIVTQLNDAYLDYENPDTGGSAPTYSDGKTSQGFRFIGGRSVGLITLNAYDNSLLVQAHIKLLATSKEWLILDAQNMSFHSFTEG